MQTTVRQLIEQLEALEKQHGSDTLVQIFSYEGYPMVVDNVKNHDIEDINDGWFHNERGDVINIECYRDKPASRPMELNNK